MTVPTLALGTQFNGTIKDDQDLYFRVDVPASGDILLTANFAVMQEAELYAKRGSLPTRSSFDDTASNLLLLHRELLVESPQPGPLYILLHDRSGAGAGKTFNIKATSDLFDLRTFTPMQGANVGPVTVTLEGAGFTKDAVVTLINSSNQVDATATLGMYVNFEASLDFNTRTVTWKLTSIDPATGDINQSDPEFAFLSPNDDAGHGSGHVTFSVTPVKGLADDASITNKANIVFDFNAPIVTNTVTNVIDLVTPTSSVTAHSVRLPASDSATRLRFTPVKKKYVGTWDITFVAWDQTAGANGGTADAGARGGYSAFSVTSDNGKVMILKKAPKPPKGSVQSQTTDLSVAANSLDQDSHDKGNKKGSSVSNDNLSTESKRGKALQSHGRKAVMHVSSLVDSQKGHGGSHANPADHLDAWFASAGSGLDFQMV